VPARIGVAPRLSPPVPAGQSPGQPIFLTAGANVGDDQRQRAEREREAMYEVEIQKKYAIAAACLVFALVGVPVALRFQRGGVGLVIGMSVAVFTVYYVGLIGGEDLGDGLILSPFIAMWTPNIIFGLAGLLGMWWIRKPGHSPHGGDWGDLYEALRRSTAWLAPLVARLPRVRWYAP
jgi:lipopolysaccharide export system permease protein